VGFETAYTDCPSGARVFSYYRFNKSNSASQLPLLVLLHGYPQNNLMWKNFVQEIPKQWDVLVPDLPGYGRSSKPINREDNSRGHSKAEWAKDIVHVIDTLCGKTRSFIPYGHDRGARLAYRLALDFPSRVAGAALLDIVPTSHVWDGMRFEKGHLETKRSHHWVFLASPYPLPETMIVSNPQFYYEFTAVGWTGSPEEQRSKEWVKDSIAPYLDPTTGKDKIDAACEDYRAGASLDIDDDRASGINPLLASDTTPPAPAVFFCPLLVLHSNGLKKRFDVNGIWTSISKPGVVQCYQIGNEKVGHFIVNEAQAETGRRTRDWLTQFEKK